MAYFNKNRGIRGSRTASERGIRFRYMISEEAKQRARILSFWQKHGLEAVREAFGVSRRTLYRWQRDLKEKHGKLESLNKQTTAPRKRRKRVVDEHRGLTITLFLLRYSLPLEGFYLWSNINESKWRRKRILEVS